MGIVEGVSDFYAGVSGNIEKAVIEAHDCRNTEPLAKGMEKLKMVLKSGVAPKDEHFAEEKRIFPVQFNPAELNITVKGELLDKTDCLVEPNQEKPEAPKAESGSLSMGHVTLSVRLLFDHVMNQDAFLTDKLNVASKKGKKGDIKKLIGIVYSVQPEVEGLIGALQNCYTRVVTFQWGKFTFTGSLETIQANYTMFSPSGHPIRAEVDLDIAQDNANITLKQWRNAFHEEVKK